ncbi:MAG: GlsB/YeaQ/YmgE family stress response membrane protein [Burkholderiales bacterium]
MNVLIWVLAGGAVGWIACSALHLNAGRGIVFSMLVGALAGYFGGSVVAPVFRGTVEAGGFNVWTLVVASVSALGVLKIADMVYELRIRISGVRRRRGEPWLL